MIKYLKGIHKDTYSTVLNLLKCPYCGKHQEIIWDHFPEDVLCPECMKTIKIEGFEPATIIYEKPS